METKFVPVYATLSRMVVQGQLVELAFALATNLTSFYKIRIEIQGKITGP